MLVVVYANLLAGGMAMKTSALKKALAGTALSTRTFVRKQGELAVRLHELMEEIGLNRRQLAEKVGRTELYVSRLLSGSANPSLKTLAEFEVVLGRELMRISGEGNSDACC